MLNREIVILLLTHTIGIIAGYFIGRYFKKKNDGDWQAKYEATQEELKQLKKEHKQEKKQANRVRQERDKLKEELQKLNLAHKELQQQADRATADLVEKSEIVKRQEIDYERLRNQFENLEKAHTKLKERYDTDMHDSKNWKSKRTEMLREIDTYKSKWTRAEQEKTKVQNRLSDYMQQINDYELLKKTHRTLSITHKKTKSDLSYWEQRHYDAHQELTVAMETIEIQRKENLEFKQLLKGAALNEQNLMKQIGNFKTKFVDTHNKYQALIKNQEGVS